MEQLQSHIWLTGSSYMGKYCIFAFPHLLGSPSLYMTLHCSTLNFLTCIYEDNFILFLISVALDSQGWHSLFLTKRCAQDDPQPGQGVRVQAVREMLQAELHPLHPPPHPQGNVITLTHRNISLVAGCLSVLLQDRISLVAGCLGDLLQDRISLVAGCLSVLL